MDDAFNVAGSVLNEINLIEKISKTNFNENTHLLITAWEKLSRIDATPQ